MGPARGGAVGVHTVIPTCLALVVVAAGCRRTSEPADLVLLGGRIVTMDPDRPEASALAARGGRIVALGSDAQIARFVGPATTTVRLAGMLAVPGLIESHGHLRNLGILRMNVDLTGTRSWDEVVGKVRDAA